MGKMRCSSKTVTYQNARLPQFNSSQVVRMKEILPESVLRSLIASSHNSSTCPRNLRIQRQFPSKFSMLVKIRPRPLTFEASGAATDAPRPVTQNTKPARCRLISWSRVTDTRRVFHCVTARAERIGAGFLVEEAVRCLWPQKERMQKQCKLKTSGQSATEEVMVFGINCWTRCLLPRSVVVWLLLSRDQGPTLGRQTFMAISYPILHSPPPSVWRTAQPFLLFIPSENFTWHEALAERIAQIIAYPLAIALISNNQTERELLPAGSFFHCYDYAIALSDILLIRTHEDLDEVKIFANVIYYIHGH
ncbi:uncharacterized protein BDR25DRAFT_361830 [Lindgomyces ingoldianus]|uniref:Uncharacterized protein n=1 Tax=Lindgomyces ingoldianus TaxID=673940 RepID=A0ACB6QDW2_9PLEO|nr:uncharacterized protein BDR25DRAFT_361830 [Lindgomyces ingoldianus]KAF2464330.1 hypothetical protein BDR25DRAFT_361830 [Lindgomyces ingoldianus]